LKDFPCASKATSRLRRAFFNDEALQLNDSGGSGPVSTPELGSPPGELELSHAALTASALQRFTHHGVFSDTQSNFKRISVLGSRLFILQ